MYTVNDLSKRYGDDLLFEHVTFSIQQGDRIGLVGPNGSGKTTLLRLMIGDEHPDSGAIMVDSGIQIGYLRQGFSDIPDGTLEDLLDIPTHGLLASQRALYEATRVLGDMSADPDESLATFERANDQFEALGGYAAIDALETLMGRFGLEGLMLDRRLSEMSGGQKTRAGLAVLLSSQPDLLILDEPTNHLDAEALAWLADFLKEYAGAVLTVSHDRGFLDDVVSRILALDPATRTLAQYSGNYSAFRDAKRHEAEEAAAAWHRQQSAVAKITRDIRAAETKARTIEASTIDYAIRKKAAKIARPAVVRKRKLERMLEDDDAAEKPVQHWGMALDFKNDTSGARDVVQLAGINVHLGGLHVLSDVELHVRHGDRIALIGGNGSGKTTLMRVMTGEVSPNSGDVRIGRGVRVGYFAQEQQTLVLDKTVLEQVGDVVAMSESELRTFLHRFLFGGDAVHRRVSDLSYGERARLMLAMLVLKETTLLLLDEPLNHLDIEAREEFEQALSRFDGTIIMVLHDRYAIRRLATRVLTLQSGRLVEMGVGSQELSL